MDEDDADGEGEGEEDGDDEHEEEGLDGVEMAGSAQHRLACAPYTSLDTVRSESLDSDGSLYHSSSEAAATGTSPRPETAPEEPAETQASTDAPAKRAAAAALPVVIAREGTATSKSAALQAGIVDHALEPDMHVDAKLFDKSHLMPLMTRGTGGNSTRGPMADFPPDIDRLVHAAHAECRSTAQL